ncbi:TetR/AcrR family transcriptional regulator [[Mycobacterium] nativiensis]|uniref:TetR/AcrR family transcriptional regulator n=1 Tax=[Mycobacterium] nativiensis TaxID=2855503 RepID=A0ABU5Y3B9_9MYCO|nr:TetR/AcrR family transcriptional regulator [Mycolicibacter sp. MYC340]MEB3034729.1 TetR/AcrR family transcriptional regulator [Mycolicibacter sp. MYC340]
MGKRQESRERIEAQILEVGRRHLLTHGAAGLSLRAVARDVGMVSSAVYRYVASRDELLTLLLVDAYSDLADAVDRARASASSASWREDVVTIAHAVRDWASAHPAGWALLYGSPVPGYHAPVDQTVIPGTRVVGAFFEAVAAGIESGDIAVTNSVAVQPLSSDFDRVREEFGFAGDDAVVAKCFLMWSALVGAVSLEVFGGFGQDTLTDPRAALGVQLALLLEMFARPQPAVQRGSTEERRSWNRRTSPASQ